MPKRDRQDVELLKTWTLPSKATLGSAVRAHGIFLEMRARLPQSSKKLIVLEAGELVPVTWRNDKPSALAPAN